MTSAAEPGAKFKDWPENLPREDLVRLLRGYAGMCMRVEQCIAEAFPDQFPLGDGEDFPADQRLVVDQDAEAMADLAIREIVTLRVKVAQLLRGLAQANANTQYWMRNLLEAKAPVSVSDQPEPLPEDRLKYAVQLAMIVAVSAEDPESWPFGRMRRMIDTITNILGSELAAAPASVPDQPARLKAGELDGIIARVQTSGYVPPPVCGDTTGPNGVGGECVLPPGHPHLDGIGGKWPVDDQTTQTQADRLLYAASHLFQTEDVGSEDWLRRAESWRVNCLGHLLGHEMPTSNPTNGGSVAKQNPEDASEGGV